VFCSGILHELEKSGKFCKIVLTMASAASWIYEINDIKNLAKWSV
jgi:hypothetical protein